MSQNIATAANAALMDDAIALHNQGRIAEATALYKEVLASDPRNADALHLLGLCLHQSGDSERGSALIKKALVLKPYEAAYHSNLGVCLKATENYEESVAILEKAIEIDPQFVPAIYNAGESYSLQGDFANGERCYRRLIELEPKLPQVWNNLGICLAKQERYDEAEQAYCKALEIQPDYGLALYSLAVLKEDTGRDFEARQFFDQALRFGFDQLSCYRHLATICLRTGEHESALEYLEQIRVLGEESSELYNNAGLAYQNLFQMEQAREAFEKALAIEPENLDTLDNFAEFSIVEGDGERAMELARRAVALAPQDALARNVLGNVHKASGHLESAAEEYRKAIALDAERPQFHSNLGVALAGLYQGEEAEEAYEKALAIAPDYVEAMLNYAAMRINVGALGKARLLLERGLQLHPGNRACLINLGRVLIDSGEFQAAEETFSSVLRSDPNDRLALSSLAALQVYRDDVTNEDIMQAHRSVGQRIADGVTVLAPASCENREGPFKIGFVSSDLKKHSVSYFLLPLIKHWDASRASVYCYANVEREDKASAWYRERVHSWQNVYAKNDEQLAAQIRSDAIDLLVDLNGYTSGNRLRVFAMKPAKVQATWLGYAHSTGLDKIDFRVGDDITDPKGVTHNTEEMVAVPDCFLCYDPMEDAGEASPLPVQNNGFVTFGSFNNSSKISAKCVELWAEVLKKTPRSRLLLKSAQFADEGVRAKLLSQFGTCGIEADRIALRARTQDSSSHLNMYAEVDIALDTYPYNGTTTTCEAMWMGVPVVSLMGTRHASRVGASLLAAVGLSDFASEDERQFVQRAVALAEDWEALAALRSGMRERLSSSQLMDGARFAQKMIDVFEGMVTRDR